MDIRVDVKLNEHVGSCGIWSVPRIIRLHHAKEKRWSRRKVRVILTCHCCRDASRGYGGWAPRSLGKDWTSLWSYRYIAPIWLHFLNKRYLVCIWNFLGISSAERALGNFIWSIKQNTFMFSLLWTGKHQQIGMNTGLADGRWILYQQKQLTTII